MIFLVTFGLPTSPDNHNIATTPGIGKQHRAISISMETVIRARPKMLTPAMMLLVVSGIVATALLPCYADAFSANNNNNNKNPIGSASEIRVTDVPPLLDVPVWSMATLNDDGGGGEFTAGATTITTTTTNMNLLTYATPVSIRPHRLYALGLFRDTLTRDNFLREKTCVLQLLSEDHVPLARLLGGTSGREGPNNSSSSSSSSSSNKEDVLADVHGIELQRLPCDDGDGGDPRLPRVLPGCPRYLQLSLVGDVVPTTEEGGDGDDESPPSSHDVVICRVDRTWTASEAGAASAGNDDDGVGHLSTGRLRELGLITAQGRIAPLPDDDDDDES